MAGYRYSISLRVSHPTRTPQSISEALRLTPSRSWMVGTPRSTPKGHQLSGVYDSTYWTVRILDGAWPSRDLGSAIDAVLDQLASNRSWFVDLDAGGGESELFVGWFFDEGNSGDKLKSTLLARLAEFHMDVSFDIYPELQN